MKILAQKRIYGFIVIVMLISSCNTAIHHDIPKDSTNKDTISEVPLTGGNLVKSEAPDAITKTEQGYALPRFDDRQAQSPINILTTGTERASNQELSLKFNIKISAAENLGHTIQLDFMDGSTTMAYGKSYQAKQFHFHTPSEHLIDGVTFPMEMHIVNILKDSNINKSPKYMVISILFKMGHENKFIKEFLNSIPGEENKKNQLQPGTAVMEDLFNGTPKDESGTYYTYKGSFTTPPYTEAVDWIVKKYIYEASPEQIYAIEKMEGDNARHVQSLNTRKVLSN